ncbi:MAG: hypothetical protein U5K69_22005 [Balneolaceae bacterium]|nr:hypothetical protein [Balneolaceae bacterium]
MLVDVANTVIEERKRTIPTPKFNDFLQRIFKERPLPIKRGVRLGSKICHAGQIESAGV